MHEAVTHKSSAELIWTWSDAKLGSPVRVTGRCLEVIIGHCTFFAPVQLAALATFHDVYSFIRKSYHARAKLCPECAGNSIFSVDSCFSLMQIGAHRFLARRTPSSWVTSASGREVRQACGSTEKNALLTMSRKYQHVLTHWVSLVKLRVQVACDVVAAALPDFDSETFTKLGGGTRVESGDERVCGATAFMNTHHIFLCDNMAATSPFDRLRTMSWRLLVQRQGVRFIRNVLCAKQKSGCKHQVALFDISISICTTLRLVVQRHF